MAHGRCPERRGSVSISDSAEKLKSEPEGLQETNIQEAIENATEEMGPGRIAMAFKVKEPHPIADIVRFLKATDDLLRAVSAEVITNKRERRDLVWCVERMDTIPEEDGLFSLRFQFQGVTKPSFEAVADRIANIYGAAAAKAMAEEIDD